MAYGKKEKKVKVKEAPTVGIAAFRAAMLIKHASSVVDLLEMPTVRAYPTGILPLDAALGTGGLPQGKILEVFGPPSGGKTALMLIAGGEAQRISGKPILYIDTEGNSDAGFAAWAQKLGVQTSAEMLLVVQPETAEETFDIIEKAIDSNDFCVIIIDSLAAMITKDELDKSLDENAKMAAKATVMQRGMRKVVRKLAHSQTVLVFINQIIANPGIKYGDPTTTPGGFAVKFYASQRLKVQPEFQGEDKKGQQVVGHTVKVKVMKNKCAPPRREATFDLNYNTGVDRLRMLLRYGTELDVLVQEGQTYVYEDQKLGKKDKVAAALLADPILRDEIEGKIREALLADYDQRTPAGKEGADENDD